MDYKIIELQEKRFVGLSDHLANNDEEMPRKIGKLWSDMFTERIYENIENKSNDFPICLYSDYGNADSAGEVLSYNVLVGYEVQKDSTQKTQYVEKIVPAGKYACFLVKGNVSESVGKAWGEIWKLPLNRSYTGDFEVYLNEDMENAVVEIYIALKQ